jgi:hypothetical protein
MNAELNVGDKVFIRSKTLLDIIKYDIDTIEKKDMPSLNEVVELLKNPFAIKETETVGVNTIYGIEIFKGTTFLFERCEIIKIEGGL